jgi:enoyl-CoA hydratase/carnithine racemase
MPAMSEPVRTEVGQVCEIVLSRPDKHNAMTVEMGQAVARAVERINQEPAARVVLVRGEGRAFCAGGDFSLIEENASATPAENQKRMLAFYRSYLSILRLRVPSIAVIHGAAIGAGLCLAMACDLRIAACEAKLGANFVRIGLHPGMGCTLLLPRLVGPAVAADLLLSGRLVSGEVAERLGLVSSAVPAASLEEAVAARIAELRRAAPIAVAQAKATLLAPLLAELDRALEREAAAQAIDFCTRDLAEAIAAFRDGRSPEFEGR